jgi:hypothetical protein
VALLALVVLVPVFLFLMRKIGDVVPGLLALGLAVAAVYLVPPTFPVDWQMGLIFVLPLFAACVYKAIRGDKRGVKGRRLP